MSCWLFHKWGKWEEEKYNMIGTDDNGLKFKCVRRYQERYCELCNKKQVERLYDE